MEIRENFSQYWDKNKNILETLGANRDVAEKIWRDCLQSVIIDITLHALNNRNVNNTYMAKRCRYFGDTVYGRTHNCSVNGFQNADDDSSFLISAAIAAATDSAILGGIVGGDLLGGIVGDLLDGDLDD